MAVYKKLNSGFLPFVEKSKMDAPNTEIVKRAKIDSSMKAVFGNERIHIRSIKQSRTEFGPNGEVVFKPSKDESRVRFVGDNWVVQYDAAGQRLVKPSGNTDHFVEITYYGTALNVLMATGGSGFNMDQQTDGGSVSPVLSGFTGSAVIAGRNYNSHQVVNIVDGLTLGWHTTKIIMDAGTFTFDAIEIVNESSQISVLPGIAHGAGNEYSFNSSELIDYNLGFENVADGDTGLRGGRVLIYIDPKDGVVKKRLNKVNPTSAFMESSDHTNEAIYRIIHWKDFGRLRSDDFSSLSTSTSDRAFALDDGATSLQGNDIVQEISTDELVLNAIGSFIIISFVGTGLDILTSVDSSGNNNSIDVDGVNVATGTGAISGTGRIKICSGLPYGTHTVRINRNDSAGSALRIRDFIIYQPKKPELIKGSVEIGDYNLLGAYSDAPSAGINSISQGVIRKSTDRELVYSGNWAINFDANQDIGGRTTFTTGSGAYSEVTFFGTGINLNYKTLGSYSNNIQVSLDGDNDFSSYTTSIIGNGSFTAATGILSQNAAQVLGSKLSISGLPLGLHTIRFTENAGNTFICDDIDIITPIHTPNTSVGSQSIKDCRNFNSLKDVNKIARDTKKTLIFNGSGAEIFESKGIKQLLRASTGLWQVWFEDEYIERPQIIGIQNDSGIIDFIDSSINDNRYWGRANVGFNTLRSNTLAQTDPNQVHIEFSGKLEKDVLEEEE